MVYTGTSNRLVEDTELLFSTKSKSADYRKQVENVSKLINCSKRSVLSRVSQNCVTKPLLFMAYSCDLQYHIKSNLVFYADDTKMISSDPTSSLCYLQHDINSIVK